MSVPRDLHHSRPLRPEDVETEAGRAARKERDLVTNSLTNEELLVQVDKAGLRLVPKDALDIEQLSKRIDTLTRESHESHEAVFTIKDDVAKFGTDLKALLDITREISRMWKRVTELETAVPVVIKRVTYLESAKSAHAEMLTDHASKHTQHEDAITGIHRRLIVVEEIVTKRTGLRRKKARVRR